MCENCQHTGPWNVLENYIEEKKSSRENKTSEVWKLIHKEEDYTSRWNDLKNSSGNVANIPAEEYKNLQKKFSLPVIICLFSKFKHFSNNYLFYLLLLFHYISFMSSEP